jgi:hypothetical protein
MKIERCIECDEPTGKAGQCEDSLYVGESGPFCETCFEWKTMIADSNEEKDALRSRIAELEDQLAVANAARQDMYGSTYCVACGAKFEEDKPDTKGRVIAHVMTCAKHPMRAVEAQRDAALAEMARLKAERKEPFGSSFCVSCGAKLELDAAFERLKRETSRAYPDSVAQIVEGIKVYPQPTKGEVASEREALERRVRLAVNEWCSCGGRGPDDEAACSACHVLHMVFEGEVS